jgi:heptosyltransferase II
VPRFSKLAIERTLKRLLMALLAHLPAISVPRNAPDWSGGAGRVLYLRPDRIGDMVLATGILRAIASAQPRVAIDVLASTINARVLVGNPHVRTVITLDKRRPWSYLRAVSHIRRAGYDAIVDSMVLRPSLTAAILMCLSGARHRIGIEGRGNEGILTLSVSAIEEAVHYIDRSAAVIAAFGLDPRRTAAALLPSRGSSFSDCAPSGTGGWGIWQPELFLSAEEVREGEQYWCAAGPFVSKRGHGRRLLVNVSASKSTKYWAVERFVATLARVRRSFPDLSILVIGLPQDLARMTQIAREANVGVAHTPNYRQMMAIVAASDWVFTADTSVTHVASAFRKPVLVMFVGDGGCWYGPYGTTGKVISTGGPSLQSLEVEPVVGALTQLIAAERERRPVCVAPIRTGNSQPATAGAGAPLMAPLAMTGPVGCPVGEPPGGSTETARTAVGPSFARS